MGYISMSNDVIAFVKYNVGKKSKLGYLMGYLVTTYSILWMIFFFVVKSADASSLSCVSAMLFVYSMIALLAELGISC